MISGELSTPVSVKHVTLLSLNCQTVPHSKSDGLDIYSYTIMAVHAVSTDTLKITNLNFLSLVKLGRTFNK